jgi:hypothetical protein
MGNNMSYENVPKNLTEQAVLTRAGRPDYTASLGDAFPVPTADEKGAVLELDDTGDRYVWTGTNWKATHTLAAANVHTELDKTAFGELAVAEHTPEVQVSAVVGLRDEMQQVFAGTGAGVAATGGNFLVTSGTSPAGFASLLTARSATYRSGQGLRIAFTALFDAPQAGSIQLAGAINSEDALAVGYDPAGVFSFVRGYDGAGEIQELQVTTPAGGAENATVTVDGVGYTVALTSGTVQHNAYELAVSLQAQVPNYTFTSADDLVVALAASPTAAGAFAFTSGTAVATWTQIKAGVAPTFDFVNIADWTHPPSWTLDHTKGTPFIIKIQYLGYGGITLWGENPVTAKLELLHIYGYANQHTTPSVDNPTFRIGWAVQNLGNTTSLTMGGASAGAFVEGKKVFDGRGRPVSSEIAGLGTTRLNLLTLRNRSVMAGRVNRVNIYPRLLVLSAAHNKTVIFHIDIGTTFSGDLLFEYLDEVNSAIEFATTPTATLLDGREVLTLRVRGSSPTIIDMSKVLDVLFPREAVTISALTSSGIGAEADASIVVIEDP